MKKYILIAVCLMIAGESPAQENAAQLSFNISFLDAHVASEFRLSGKSTLLTAVGFGYGSVNGIYLREYYPNSNPEQRGTDVASPEIFFGPYLNIQYRNYFLQARESREGYYTGNHSGLYLGARLKFSTKPVILVYEGETIRENYMLGLIAGWQKALGSKRKFIINANTGISTHANYNLSFFGYKPLLYASAGYILN